MIDPLNSKIILIYTMTDGLGDYLIMGDLVHKASLLMHKAEFAMIHRANPHIALWPYNRQVSFINCYKISQMINLVKVLRAKRAEGYLVFGLQMAPGSVQGFLLHTFLKKSGALDYIVDFNLVNADIVTLAKGTYILDRHLNQLSDLFALDIPEKYYKLQLPLDPTGSVNQGMTSKIIKKHDRIAIGIHPWSRRGTNSFFWPLEKWQQLIKTLLGNDKLDFIVFGKDSNFELFHHQLQEIFCSSLSRFSFIPAKSVAHLAGTVAQLDLIITVNTAVVHIGYSLNKKMVILSGPTLELWNPRCDGIRVVKDKQAIFNGADKITFDKYISQVSRIKVDNVVAECQSLLSSSS